MRETISARRLTLLLSVAQVALALLLAGLGELALLYSGPTAPDPPFAAALFVIGAWVYGAAGVIAWLRRPSSLMGLLLTAGAFVWLLAGLNNTTVPALVAAGQIVQTLPIALLIHLLLAFPSGRLRSTAARVTTLAAYVISLVGQIPIYLFRAGPLMAADRPDLVDAGRWTQRGFGAIVVLATCALLARRLLAVTPAQRRVLAPLSLYGIVAVLVIPLNSLLSELIDDPLTRATVQLTVMGLMPVAFVLAASLGGFARTGDVEELGAQLGAAGRARLGDLLADTLGDRSLALLFRVPDTDGWVNGDGVPTVPPSANGRRGVVEVELAGETIGAIVYDATLLTRPAEVREAARVVALALDRERLTVELRVSRARLVEASDTERRRIARDLHDGLQSRLVLLAVQAGVIGGEANQLHDEIQTAIDELRALVHGVMPAELTERGLAAAVEALADRMPTAVALEFESAHDDRLPPLVESTGYFVVSEALVNAVKHARADELGVSLRCGADDWLRIEVRDNGIGGARIGRNGGGAGLRSMVDRVEALGGRLRIDSATGAGTNVRVELPCGS